jgi:hypothetical protein
MHQLARLFIPMALASCAVAWATPSLVDLDDPRVVEGIQRSQPELATKLGR